MSAPSSRFLNSPVAWWPWLAAALALLLVAGCRQRVAVVESGGADTAPPYGLPNLTAHLSAVTFADDGRLGWAVGKGGTVRSTVDGGKSWKRVQGVPSTAALLGVAFASDGRVGFAVGENSTVLRTADGGATWAKLSPFLFFASLSAVHVSGDGARIWVVGSGGAIIGSADGGLTWKRAASSSTDDLETVEFSADGKLGWAAGDEGVLLLTEDQGVTWKQGAGIGRGEYLMSVSFAADGLHGCTVGDYGAMYFSDDGGRHWIKNAEVLTNGYLDAVDLAPDGVHGCAVGDNGVILLTADGGRNWKPVGDTPTAANLYAVHFLPDGRSGWAVGDAGIILHTSDGGQAWERETGPSGFIVLNSVGFAADALHGLAVGSGGALLRTEDGGHKWKSIRGLPAVFLNSVALAADGRRAWVVGAAGLISRSTDGGVTWAPAADPGTKQNLSGVAFAADGQRGWVVGAGSTILNSTDGGETWQRHTGVPAAAALNAVCFNAAGKLGWAVGDWGVILRTTDGGQKWEKVTGVLTSRSLRSVTFGPDGRKGWVAGDNSTLLESEDGGQTWGIIMAEASSLPFNAVAFSTDGRKGWAVGGENSVYRTVDGGKFWWQVVHDAKEGPLQAVTTSADGEHVWTVGSNMAIRTSSSDEANHYPFAGHLALKVEVQNGVLRPLLDLPDRPLLADQVQVLLRLSGPRATGDLAKGFQRYFALGQLFEGWKTADLGSGVYTGHIELFDGWNIVTRDFQFGSGMWARIVGFMGWDIATSQPLEFFKSHGTQNFTLLVAVYCLVIVSLFAFWPSGFVYWHEKMAPLVSVLPLPTKATDKVNQLAGLFLISRPRALNAVVRRYAADALAELEALPEVAARPLWVAAPLQVEDQHFGTAVRPYEEPEGLPKGMIYVRGLTELRTHLVKRRWWLSIEGPGGVGKSALAFQLARWFAAPEKEARIGLPQAIPLFIRSPKGGIDAEVLAELKRVLELPKLSRALSGALLRQRRVLAVIDGISEKAADLASLEQGPLNPAKGAALTAFAVMTSRRRIQLAEVIKVIPGPVDLGTMDAVLDRYLEDVVGAGRFNSDQREAIREALKAIMKEISGAHNQPPEIPMIFLKLLILRADVLLAANEVPGTPIPFEARLPGDLAELVDAYLASLLESRIDCVAQAVLARHAALACIGPDGRPAWRPLAAYDARAVNHEQLEALVTTGLLVKDAADVGDPRYKFALDPIADYLAAKELVLGVRDGKMTVAELQAALPKFAAGSDVAARVHQVARALGVTVD